jgi:hypothetical protein
VLLKDSQVSTDQINEKTSAAGVTIDGVLLKDSQVTTDQINEKTSATGVTIDGVLLKDNGVVTGAGTVSAPVYSTTGDLNTGIFFPAADTIAFAEGGAEAMRIDSDGNVGIGTTSPVARLNILGDFGQQLVLQDTVSNSTNKGATFTGGHYTNTEEPVLVAASFSSSTGNTCYYGGGWTAGNSATELRFYTAANTTTVTGTERARITSDGTLLVGTTTVAGSGGCTIRNNMIICNGIYGTTLTLSPRDIYMDSDGYFGYIASIKNSKTNIADVSDVSWLYSLQPVSFNYKKQNRETKEYLNDFQPEKHYGLIAEDVEKVNQELCFYDETENGQELRGVSYTKLITPMLKAIQELKAELDEAKARIAALEQA